MDLVDPNTLAPESISVKGAALVSSYNSASFPHDWTEGAGTLGAAGEIDLPAPAAGSRRQWLYVQNQSAAAVTVKHEARKIDGVTQVFAGVVLGAGSGAGAQGATEERGFSAFVPQGIVRITGAANAQIVILEVVE